MHNVKQAIQQLIFEKRKDAQYQREEGDRYYQRANNLELEASNLEAELRYNDERLAELEVAKSE